MPPRIRDYGAADWLRLRPLMHRLKTRRYRAQDAVFRSLPARAGNVELTGAKLEGRKVLASIAFTDPQTIAWQAPLVRHYVPEIVYIVADNTPDDRQALAIEEVCTRLDVPYLRLPDNPTRSASRSHGLALNWVWHNLLRPHKPLMFGFIDDDLFPTAPNDPFYALSDQDFFGVIRPGVDTSIIKANSRWFLWAGFSMFRFAAVRDKPIDFSQDWFLGLDTGGANWNVLYRHVRRESIQEQATSFVPFKEGLEVADAPFQWCGPWLHEVGLMGKPEYAKQKRAALADLLAPHLARTSGATGSHDKIVI